jgi:hypothetical protein
MQGPLPNMNDEELDKLFKKAAGEYAAAHSSKESFAQKEEAWEKLQEKLDTPPPAAIGATSPQNRRNRKFLLLIPLLIIASIVIWQIKEKGSRMTLSSQNKFDTARHKKIMNEVSPLAPVAITLNPDSGKVPHHIVSGNPVIMRQNKSHVHYDDNLNNGFTRSSHTVLIPSTIEMIPHTTGILLADKNILLSPVTTAAGNVQSLSEDINPSRITIASENNYTPQKPNKNKDSNSRHWFIGITLGPDWSSVAGEGWGTGVSGGLKLDYQPGRKWIVETGISAAKKIYTTSPYNYNPPGNPGGYYGNIQSIDANCLLIDLPLNVDYILWNKKNSSVFVGTGLSSTWMHHETYTYHIKTNTGGWEQYQQDMYNKEYQLFSIWNIAAGYEKEWRHISLEISPYVKVPLSGIGYGRVKLLSTGIQFTLKHALK